MTMSYLKRKGNARRIKAIGLVLLLHSALIYVLISRSATLYTVEVIREPFVARIIEQLKPRPPEQLLPPDRPPLKIRGSAAAPPKLRLPVKSFVPAPEVTVQNRADAEIAAVSHVPLPPASPASLEPVNPAGAPTSTRTAASVKQERCVKPEYPPASLRAEESGTVALSFFVDVDGKVIESRIDHSSGYYRLDEAARSALARCEFRPAHVDGKPQRAWAHIKYEWRLE
jgi:protein TonB